MDKQAFLKIASQHYDKLKAVGKEPDFFTLESEFDKIWTEFGRQVLEKTVSKVPANPQKKTSSRRASGVSK